MLKLVFEEGVSSYSIISNNNNESSIQIINGNFVKVAQNCILRNIKVNNRSIKLSALLKKLFNGT